MRIRRASLTAILLAGLMGGACSTGPSADPCARGRCGTDTDHGGPAGTYPADADDARGALDATEAEGDISDGGSPPPVAIAASMGPRSPVFAYPAMPAGSRPSVRMAPAWTLAPHARMQAPAVMPRPMDCRTDSRRTLIVVAHTRRRFLGDVRDYGLALIEKVATRTAGKLHLTQGSVNPASWRPPNLRRPPCVPGTCSQRCRRLSATWACVTRPPQVRSLLSARSISSWLTVRSAPASWRLR
jgi:hypothetical protein